MPDHARDELVSLVVAGQRGRGAADPEHARRRGDRVDDRAAGRHGVAALLHADTLTPDADTSGVGQPWKIAVGLVVLAAGVIVMLIVGASR
jgi:hypothetical protein